jgi:ABC-type Fe3+-hydroxamate transport system substrate-binding protein
VTRIVSLVPSITETLLGWGQAPVGVTRFCEGPGIPTVGGTKNPDIEAILALRPDVVLMDKEENREPDADALISAGVRVVATDVCHIDDVNPALARLAGAIGAAPGLEPPRALVAVPGRRLKVFVPIWRRPWMTVGGQTYGSSLLSSVGFDNVFAADADPYPTLELDQVSARHPDLVLAPSEPYAFGEKHRAELEQVAPVVFVDGRDLFWWGGRTAGAQDRLAGMARDLAGA